VQIELRPAAGADEPLLRELFVSARPLFAQLPAELRAVVVDQQFEAQRADFGTSYPHARQQLMLVDGEPVGQVWVDWSTTRGRILDFAVAPAFRRKGVGTAVVTGLVAEAAARGLPLRASVECLNVVGRAFWRRCGFAATAEGPLFIEIEYAAASDRRAP
jgi:ribosomal protein S18 acetylase RimI-like enzyme